MLATSRAGSKAMINEAAAKSDTSFTSVLLLRRYATYIYLTLNPLYPLPTSGEGAQADDGTHLSPGSAASLNPLRDFLVLSEAPLPPFSGDTETDFPATATGSQGAEMSPKRHDELSPQSPRNVEEGANGRAEVSDLKKELYSAQPPGDA